LKESAKGAIPNPNNPMKTIQAGSFQHLRAATFGLALAILTILFGQVGGIVFGLNEDIIKDRLKAEATAVQETIYRGDAAAGKAVLEKSWTYMKRAHLHAGGMGTTAVALILATCAIGTPRVLTFLVSLALGAGGLGYSVFWMWAGFRAPSLGGGGPAKESLKWLAMPSAGGFVVATVIILVLLVVVSARRNSHGGGELR
jgi:hypothetical protein